ncbi:uroporphyrinogen decarboxylase family protein, partial [Actinomycetota bacterium]
PFLSLEDYRKFYKLYQAEIINNIRKFIPKNSKIILKSSGSIYQFIPDFIEIGIDVLSQVQPLANNMEPWRLKKEFGKHIAFLGGFDIQYLLPFGTKKDIKKGAEILIEEYAKDGGYIFGPSYVISHTTPPENIYTMFDSAYEYGSYSINKTTGEIDFVNFVKKLIKNRDTLSL